MSWFPGKNIPQDFVEIQLNDDVSSSDESATGIMEMDILHREQDGSLVPLEDLLQPYPNADAVYEFSLAGPLPEHLDEAGEASESEPEEDLEPSDLDLELRPRGGLVRGRGRGRGAVRLAGRAGRGSVLSGVRGRRGRGGSVRGRDGSVWMRGQPLVQRYLTDEELPEATRHDIARSATDRERRERTARDRREALGDVLNEEEKVFMEGDNFVWEPMGEWRGTKETFLRESPGPTSVFNDAYGAFRAYWDDNILSHIVAETNRHAQGIRSERFQKVWYETTLDELLVLFAFWMMLSIIRMPSIKSCYSKRPFMQTGVFQRLLREDRYWNLNRAFYLANGSSDVDDRENVLYPMGPIMDHLNSKFKEHYVMDQDICIDESLTLWRGALKFMQYIKTKAARFGIKMYELCESKTGYCWSFFVYSGRRSTSGSALPSTASFVMRLVRPLLNLGHVLYMDNWFNSPLLARYLKRRGTDCVGTLRSNRKNVPPVVQKAPLVEGEYVARQSGDVAVVALQDRRRLHLISTCHNTDQVLKEGRPCQYKLQLVDDYNRGMGGVDRLEQMLEPYLVERKQCKDWTKKLFKRLLNMSIQNARILVEQSRGSKIDSLVFRIALVESIASIHLGNVRRDRGSLALPKKPSRLVERHFMERIPVTEEMRAKVAHRTNRGRVQCVWCRMCGRAIKTVYHCPDCEVALCFERGCFKFYHTFEEPKPEHIGNL